MYTKIVFLTLFSIAYFTNVLGQTPSPTLNNNALLVYVTYWGSSTCSGNPSYILAYNPNTCFKTSTSTYLKWSYTRNGQIQLTTTYYSDSTCSIQASPEATTISFSTSCTSTQNVPVGSRSLYYIADYGYLPYTGEYIQSRFVKQL